MDTGGPAFPVPSDFIAKQDGTGGWINTRDYGTEPRPGMTLRDYFAGIAFARLVQAHIDQSIDELGKPEIASESYSYADAMLAEKARRERR